MKNLRPFEIVLIGIFAFFAVGALIYVSLFKPKSSENVNVYGDSVIIWGTFDGTVISPIISDIARGDSNFTVVRYEQKDTRFFESELLSAIAEGRSPDLIILPHSLLVSYASKLVPQTYETFSERVFKDRYIDGSDIFMMADGVYGIPFAVDPLMMYWNRDVFSSSGLANPPRTWETLVNETVPAVTRKNEQLAITQSAVAFGEYSNIDYAKKTLAALLLQSGNSIVERRNDQYAVTLNRESVNNVPSAQAVFAFYSQFVAPGSASYTWNRSLPNDRTQFLAGKLGLYFAPASERTRLENQNPNLDFDVTTIPQGAGATTLRTYGDFYAFAVPRASLNYAGAIAAAHTLGSQENAHEIAVGVNMAPVYRADLAAGTTDTYTKNVYDAALTARGWYDPLPRESNEIFREVVEGISSGRVRVESMVSDAAYKLELLFR